MHNNLISPKFTNLLLFTTKFTAMKPLITFVFLFTIFLQSQAQSPRPKTAQEWEIFYNSNEKQLNEYRNRIREYEVKFIDLSIRLKDFEKDAEFYKKLTADLDKKLKEKEAEKKEKSPFSLGFAVSGFYYHTRYYELLGNSNASPKMDTAIGVSLSTVLSYSINNNFNIVLSVPVGTLSNISNISIGGKGSPFGIGIGYNLREFKIGVMANLFQELVLDAHKANSNYFAISKYPKLIVGDRIPNEILAIHAKNKLKVYPSISIIVPFWAIKG